MVSAANSELWFLKRDPLYDLEKVYELKYEPPTGLAKSNMMLEKRQGIQIRDIRGDEESYSFEENGFTVMKFDSQLAIGDYEDETKLKTDYFPKLAFAVQDLLKADRIQVFDYVVRKRHPDFPVCTGGFYEFSQPSSLAHVDTSHHNLERVRRDLNETDELAHMRCQYVNAWKPLKGPVRDWPLTLCDPKTIDPEKDLQARDLVYPNVVHETYQIHYHPEQRWYYLRDQMPDEVWVFLQADSSGRTGVPHTAFSHPDLNVFDSPRQSIEVRMLAYYKD